MSVVVVPNPYPGPVRCDSCRARRKDAFLVCDRRDVQYVTALTLCRNCLDVLVKLGRRALAS